MRLLRSLVRLLFIFVVFAQQSGLAIKQANSVASLGRVPLLDVEIKG